MKTTCVISFGNSTKYRLPLEEDNSRDIQLIESDVRNYIKGRFPEIAASGFYSRSTIEEVDPAVAAGYPPLTDSAVKDIEKTLSVEVEDAESLQVLNSNAPWGTV